MIAALGALALMVGLVSIMVLPGALMRVRDIRRERERKSPPPR